MPVLVIGRGRQIVDSVTATIRRHGFEALGTTTDDEALSHLGAQKIDLLVIGGGVEPSSRSVLKQRAAATGAPVLEKPLGFFRSIDRYVEREILPRLKS